MEEHLVDADVPGVEDLGGVGLDGVGAGAAEHEGLLEQEEVAGEGLGGARAAPPGRRRRDRRRRRRRGWWKKRIRRWGRRRRTWKKGW